MISRGSVAVTYRFCVPEPQVRSLPPHPAERQIYRKGGLFTESTAVTITSLLTDASEALVDGVGIVWDMVTGNPLLALFVGASIVSLGFSFFRKAKRAAR